MTDTGGDNRGLILLVEDDPIMLKRCTAEFRRAGYEVVTATNGLEGVRTLYQEMPDVVVSDVVMPELNGYQLCRMLKNDSAVAHIPIILLTSLGSEQDRFRGTRSGADRYLVKQADFGGLLDAVAELVGTQRQTGHYSGTLFYMSGAEMDDSSIRSKVSFILDKLLFEQTLINEARRLTAFINNRDSFVHDLIALIRMLFQCDALGVFLRATQRVDLYIDAPDGVSVRNVEAIAELAVRQSGDLRLMDEHAVSYVGQTHLMDEDQPVRSKRPDGHARLISELVADGKHLGSLVLTRREPERFTNDAAAVLDLLASNVAMGIQLLYLYEDTRFLSVTDPLTLVHNRRFLLDILEQQYEQFRRYGSTGALLFIDIDNFKLINDTFGHKLGDMALSQLAALLEGSIRTVDLLARFGGEEFIILLPQTDLDQATTLAERLRARVEKIAMGKGADPISMTISVGVAKFTPDMTSATAIIDMADRAMYDAKQAGKNQVCVYANGEGRST